MRDICLDVVIPKQYVWEFMEEFGRSFAIRSSHGGSEFKAVEGYYEHPNGWHIQVCVSENQEDSFRTFLHDFAKHRSLVCDLRSIEERYTAGDLDS